MIEVEDKIISKDLFEKKFVCDLQQCKGACCVEGDSGAPLSKKEVDDIESNLSIIKEEMSPIGKKAIESKNFYYGSDKFYKNSVSLPIYVKLNENKQDKIIKIIKKYFN